MAEQPSMDIVDRLRRWADAREDRNARGGHGARGTALLRQTADSLAALRAERDALTKLREGLDRLVLDEDDDLADWTTERLLKRVEDLFGEGWHAAGLESQRCERAEGERDALTNALREIQVFVDSPVLDDRERLLMIRAAVSDALAALASAPTPRDTQETGTAADDLFVPIPPTDCPECGAPHGKPAAGPCSTHAATAPGRGPGGNTGTNT